MLVREFDPVHERITYRGAIIPSCRRLLQTFVGRSGAEDESLHYEQVVAALMRRSDLDRRILLSEMVAGWLTHEYGPTAKETKARG
jgi:hypothetical protein